MRLRSRKSEYQHCYSSPSKEYFKELYEEQLTYRLKRRQEEHFHSLIHWDTDSSDDDDIDKKSDNTNALSVPDGPCNTEEGNQNSEKLSEKGEQDDVLTQQSNVSAPSDVGKAPLTEDESQPDVNKKSDSAKSNDVTTQDKKEKSKERPPFLSYGWANKQVETGRKKTFNVQAPQKTIYPGVLKRLSFINLEKSKYKQKMERRAQTPATASAQTKKATDTSAWLSEYQRCYSSQSSRPSSSSSQRKRSINSRQLHLSKRRPAR